MADDISVAILREIRDEIRANGERIDGVRTELSERIDGVRTELSKRIDQTNERIGHVESAVLELSEQQRFMVRLAKAGQERDRRLEHEVITLRGRVEVIEARLDEE